MKRFLRFAAALLCAAQVFALSAFAAVYDGGGESFYNAAAVERVFSLNIMQGSIDGGVHTFRPDDFLTRQEFFRIIYSISNAGSADPQEIYLKKFLESGFADKEDVANWALPYAGYCIFTGIIVGDGQNRLNPRAEITYLEASITLFRLLGYSNEYLRQAEGESQPQWYIRLFNKGVSDGLYAGLSRPVSPSTVPVLSLTRQDSATMICNLLDMYTVYDAGSGYKSMMLSLEKEIFGTVEAKKSLVVSSPGAAGEAVYTLLDGAKLPLFPGREAADLTGHTAEYVSSTSSAVLSWAGSPAPGETSYSTITENFSLRVSPNGNVTMAIQQEDGTTATFFYMKALAEENPVYLFDSGRLILGPLSYERLLSAIGNYSLFGATIPLKIVLNSEGYLQALVFG